MWEFFSGREARRIAWRGSTVMERINTLRDSRRIDVAHVSRTRYADVDLSEWRSQYSETTDSFDDRICASGTTEAEWRVAIGREMWPRDVAVPSWVVRTDTLCRYLGEEIEPPRREGDGDVPFEHVLRPMVQYARTRVDVDNSNPALTRDAIDDATDWLRQRLGTVCIRTLQTEFEVFKQQQNAESTDGLYCEFVRSVGQRESLRFLGSEYPVLWRLISTRIRQWSETVETLAQRVEASHSEIVDRFGVETPACVSGLEFLSADSHRGGDVVVALNFSRGTTVVYKPRPVGGERLLRQIVSDVCSNTGIGVREITTIDCDTHGFVEWIDPAQCSNESELRSFFRRAGATLAVAYCTCTNDCHRENVIADGASPVLVDGETLCHPKTGSASNNGEYSRHTVLTTGFLPYESGDRNERQTVENASLVEPDSVPPTSPFDSDYWTAINTGRMSFDSTEISLEDSERPSNLPSLDGDHRTGREFVPEITEGFSAAYKTVRSDPSVVLDREFEGVEQRVVGGFSWMYRDILSTVVHPSNLEDGEKVTQVVEQLLARADDGVEDRRVEMFHAERRALLNTDIPRFSSRLGTAETDDSVPTSLSGLDRVKRRLNHLSNIDRQRQADQIRLALNPEYTPENARQPLDDAPAVGDRGAGSTIIESTVRSICSELLDLRSKWLRDGSWARLQQTGDGDRVTVAELGPGLYHGIGGIAVFLALASSRLNDRVYRNRAVSLGDSVIESATQLAEESDGPVTDLGMVSGFGSLLYTLSKLGELTDESKFLNTAVRISEVISERGVSADASSDLLSGKAGLLSALTKLSSLRDHDCVRQLMCNCADGLLRTHSATTSGTAVWKPNCSTPAVGLSHGVSGVAHALSQYDRQVSDERARAVVDDVRRYEQRQYDPETNNWPDYRDHSELSVGAGDDRDSERPDAWCHGRTGVLLCRLAGPKSTMLTDWERKALRGVGRADGTAGSDALCCGTAGHVDTLVTIGNAVKDERCHDDADRLAEGLCRRWSGDGCLSLPMNTATVRNPTLFQGTAGVGYSLLRTITEEPGDSVLRFE